MQEFRLATKQGDTEAAIAALENAKQLFAADTKRKTALFLQMACSLEGVVLCLCQQSIIKNKFWGVLPNTRSLFSFFRAGCSASLRTST